jgi:hypothetical protein
METKLYTYLKNPNTKHLALSVIQNEILEITDKTNIVTLTTDLKSSTNGPYVRTTIFVCSTGFVNFNYIHRVEEHLKKQYQIKFKLVFCNASLTDNESLRLSAVKGNNTISFLDLENFITIGASKEDEIVGIENLIFSTLHFSKNDALVVCANKRLISLAREVLKDYEEKNNITFIRTGGKDCSDLRLVQSIQKLYDLKILNNFKLINIASGDGFFKSITDWLGGKNFSIRIYGQENKTHHSLLVNNAFVLLDNKNLVLPVI